MASDSLAVYVLDVGQGDCTFIVPPQNGGAILFDCNDAYVAERFVSNHGLHHLEAVVVSHLDRDHIRGIVPFLKNHFAAGRTVGRLFIGLDRQPNAGEKSEIAILLLHALEWSVTPPCPGFSLADPTRTAGPVVVASGVDWSVELMLPFYEQRLRATGLGGENPNLCSAVLRVSHSGTSVLVTGDSPLSALEKIDDRSLSARAVRTPHHAGDSDRGGRMDSFDKLYEAVTPSHAIVSVGTNNQHKHPLPEHLSAARLSDRSCRVRCTQLTPRCHPDPWSLRDDALLVSGGVTWPYRHRAMPGDPKRAPTQETPCAGSIAIWIDPTGGMHVEPAVGSDHDLFVGKLSHPLCEAV